MGKAGVLVRVGVGGRGEYEGMGVEEASREGGGRVGSERSRGRWWREGVKRGWTERSKRGYAGKGYDSTGRGGRGG